MNRSLFWLMLVICVTPLLCGAVVRHSDRFEEIMEQADKDTLIVLELDDVILEPVQLLGSLHHFRYEVESTANAHVRKGIAQETAIRIAYEAELSAWVEIQRATRVRPMEVDTSNAIRNKQKEGARVMGFTLRPPDLASATERQLRSLAVDFTARSPFEQDFDMDGAKFIGGILYDELALNGDKGLIFLRFLKAIGLKPSKVLYVSERVDTAGSIDAALRDSQIPCVAYRYSRAETRKKRFDPKITAIQSKYFNGILPDEIARTLVKTGK